MVLDPLSRLRLGQPMVVGVLLLLSGVCSAGGEDTTPGRKQFRAGAFAIDITPTKLPVIVNGGMSQRSVSAVTDRLHARCLVLDNGSTRIAFAVVDSCVIHGDLMDRAKKIVNDRIGVPPDRVLISATHSHSTPSVVSLLGSGRNDDYAAYLGERIAAGIIAANERLQPARLGWGVGKDPHNVYCRRFVMKPGTAATNPFGGTTNDRAQMNPGYQNPNAIQRTGTADIDVSLLSIQTSSGKPLAVLANYSTHYAGVSSGLSADYFGVFARRIGELIGADGNEPEFVGMMTNGTSGDANCCDFANSKRDFSYRSVGEDVAQAAFQAYQQIQYIEWAPIRARQKVLQIGVRKADDKELAAARDFLAEMGDRLPATIPEVYARETVLLADWPDSVEVKLQAIGIGTLGIAAIPCEVYGSTGLAIKQQSPFSTTFNIELANGYNGYLPPPDQFELGGYTTWRARSSYLDVEAEPLIRQTILALLEAVRP
jgi:neutral ceramidase